MEGTASKVDTMKVGTRVDTARNDIQVAVEEKHGEVSYLGIPVSELASSWFIKVLDAVKEHSATDIFVRQNTPVRIGVLKRSFPIIPVIKPTQSEIMKLIEHCAPKEVKGRILKESFTGRILFAFTVQGYGRFRVCLDFDCQGIGFGARVLPYTIPYIGDLDKFGYMAPIRKLLDFDTRPPKGLILHTGITGSGKTTLIASELDDFCKKVDGAIYTYENPVEYIHMMNQRAFIRQYEIPTHYSTLLDGLMSSLLNNLIAVVVGEVKTQEEIHALMNISMRGYLVISTIHTENVMNTLKFLDRWGGESNEAWRHQISQSLLAIVSQKLIYKEGHGYILIPEVLVMNNVIRQLIAKGSFQEIETGLAGNQFKQEGSVTFDQVLQDLANKEILTMQEASELKGA